MTTLVGILSTGKGTWGHISALIAQGSYARVVLITNDFGKKTYTPNENTILIETDLSIPIPALTKTIADAIKPYVESELEVDVSIISGSGKEHMALLAALLSSGCGIRLVYEDNGVKTL